LLHGPVPIWGQPNTRSWRGRSRPMAGSPRFVGYSTTALRCPDEENATDDILLTDTNPIQAITFRDVEGAETVRFSHGQFGLVVQTLHHAAGELLFGAEIVQDQPAVRA